MSPAEARVPRTSGTSAGLERVVALALGAMVAVLTLVLVDVSRARGPERPPDFDWQNPLLLAQPGQCVEIGDTSSPGFSNTLAVRAPGVVLRPFDGPKTIAGWKSGALVDPRTFPAYLLTETRGASEPDRPKGLPPAKSSPDIFPLNSFGMPIDTRVVLLGIEPVKYSWNGQTRNAYAIQLNRFDSHMGGPWVVYMSKDAPVLGTMGREYTPKPGHKNKQTFRIPEGCK